MNVSYFNSVLKYKTTLVLLDKMVSQGIINRQEHTQIDTMLAEKYCISSCSIYRSNYLMKS